MDKNFKGTKEEYLEFRKKRNEANQRYYSKPEVREKKRRYSKNYRKENKDKISEYGYKLRARPETKERLKKWREENKEYLRAYNQRPDRKEKKKISDKKYWEKVKSNPERHKKHLVKQKKNRIENKEKIKNYNRKYHFSEKGKLKYIKHNHLRLSKKFGNEFSLNQNEIKSIYQRDKVCVYCGSSRKLELDHIIPISKGGNSNYNNFVLACRNCNPSKSNKDVFRWCKNQGIEVPEIVINLLEKQKSRH